jgi:hypothetical protein
VSGKIGTSQGGMESSPERRKRQAAKRRREEKRWAKRSGPVTVRFVDPATLRPGLEAGSSTPPVDGDVGEGP